MEALDSGGVFGKLVQIGEMKSRTVWFLPWNRQEKEREDLKIVPFIVSEMQ